MMAQEAKAQTAHNLQQCYLNKNWKPNTEGVNCPACRNKINKEKAAKIAEQKKRDEAIWAAGKAEKEAKQKAFEAEQKRKREEAAKPKSGEVVINAQPQKTTATKAPTDVKATITDKTIFASGGGIYNNTHFKNEKGEIIIDNPEWIGTYAIKDISFTEEAPDNFGVVRIAGINSEKNRASYNLVNAKGEYLIDDNAIWSMLHIRNGWFLIASKPNNYYLLNVQTKKKHTLPYYGQEPVLVVDMAFVPVFSDKVALRKLPMEGFGSMTIGNIFPPQTKEGMIKHFPDKVNEGTLSRYSFVLFHTDYGKGSYLELSSYRYLSYDGQGKIEMYGITETGKMETIRIQ